MNKMATPEAIDRIEENNKIRDLESKIYQDFVNQENGDLHEKKFIYVEGPDYYWVRPKWWFDNNPEWDSEGTFVRFRKPSYGLDNDATAVFYTVYDTTDGKPRKADSFLEIEVNEDNMKNTTTDQAWAVISKYEKILEPLGINARKRLYKSLFAMYHR
ncbi:unnamed protein product [Sphagnum jensenii]|uniref:Uncharacterized protein n=1 Tax=Sphagnum jensenii TaxID=128206 RepID=A0ABP0VFA7_9BRYO